MRFELSFFLALFSYWATCSASAAVCDLALINGRVWTENPRQAEAQAIAISGNRIIEVGSTLAISKLIGPDTKVIELGGKRVSTCTA